MSDAGSSGGDRDLLARLNALKKSHIDLDDKTYKASLTGLTSRPTTRETPARDLHADLLSRFKSLNGNSKQPPEGTDHDHEPEIEGFTPAEDDKTVEELLADLGANDSWNIEKDEQNQIDDLLSSAKEALTKPESVLSKEAGDEQSEVAASRSHAFPSIDVELMSPEGDENSSDDEPLEPRKSKQQLETDIDNEANDIIARLRDEIKNAPPAPPSPSDSKSETDSNSPNSPSQSTPNPSNPNHTSLDLPSTPSKDPVLTSISTSTSDPSSDLESRFASLSLPYVPTTIKPMAPSSLSPHQSNPPPQSSSAYTDAEISSWCCICNDDATLSCPGCDDDLYCTNCWLEGHRGPDAGYDERTHRAVVYNKGVGAEKKRRQKVGVGA